MASHEGARTHLKRDTSHITGRSRGLGLGRVSGPEAGAEAGGGVGQDYVLAIRRPVNLYCGNQYRGIADNARQRTRLIVEWKVG